MKYVALKRRGFYLYKLGTASSKEEARKLYPNYHLIEPLSFMHSAYDDYPVSFWERVKAKLVKLVPSL